MKNEASEEAHFTSRIFQNQQQLSSFYVLLSFQGFEVQSYPHISFLRPADIRSVLSKYIYFPLSIQSQDRMLYTDVSIFQCIQQMRNSKNLKKQMTLYQLLIRYLNSVLQNPSPQIYRHIRSCFSDRLKVFQVNIYASLLRQGSPLITRVSNVRVVQ